LTPEDVLLESISAASIYGDSPEFRRKMCERLRQCIEQEKPDPAVVIKEVVLGRTGNGDGH
jgi:hypothetical protein